MKTIIAAILGGILVFAWNAVSWMVLDWHVPTIRTFANEMQVMQALADNAPASGIYIAPKLSAETTEATDGSPATGPIEAPPVADPMEATSAPFAFVAFMCEGINTNDMGRQYAFSLIGNILAALFIALLVLSAEGLGYIQRVLFIVTIGIIIALAGRLPYWVWWHFPTDFMLIDCADVVIGWSIAALLMAALTGADRSRLGASYRRVRM